MNDMGWHTDDSFMHHRMSCIYEWVTLSYMTHSYMTESVPSRMTHSYMHDIRWCKWGGTNETTHCNTLQHTATHCNTLQRTATHCNTLQRTATHCNTLQRTATQCNTLQRTATHCNTLQHTATHCNTLQRTATHCNTLIFYTKINDMEEHTWMIYGSTREVAQINNTTHSYMTHSYMQYDSFICKWHAPEWFTVAQMMCHKWITRLIYICCITRSNMRYDSFICKWHGVARMNGVRCNKWGGTNE